MKLILLIGLCLHFTDAESKAGPKRSSLRVDGTDDHLDVGESGARNDGTDMGARSEFEAETTSVPAKRVLLRRNYAIFPGGKVPIPEGIQLYRNCFGDDALEKILDWILKSCLKGLCSSMIREGLTGGYDLGMGDLASALGIGYRSNKNLLARTNDTGKEPGWRGKGGKRGQQENAGKRENKKSSSTEEDGQDEEVEEEEEVVEQDAIAETGSKSKDRRKRIGNRKPNARRKKLPYKKERRELERVTLQFKALPNAEKDKFCEYLENDLVEEPMALIRSLLGGPQRVDKKESGVHYDRNRGRILASMPVREVREGQILRWACQDRREGQRKLYPSSKRFHAPRETSTRDRRRRIRVENKENNFGDLALHPDTTVDEKMVKHRKSAESYYPEMDGELFSEDYDDGMDYEYTQDYYGRPRYNTSIPYFIPRLG